MCRNDSSTRSHRSTPRPGCYTVTAVDPTSTRRTPTGRPTRVHTTLRRDGTRETKGVDWQWDVLHGLESRPHSTRKLRRRLLLRQDDGRPLDETGSGREVLEAREWSPVPVTQPRRVLPRLTPERDGGRSSAGGALTTSPVGVTRRRRREVPLSALQTATTETEDVDVAGGQHSWTGRGQGWGPLSPLETLSAVEVPSTKTP